MRIFPLVLLTTTGVVVTVCGCSSNELPQPTQRSTLLAAGRDSFKLMDMPVESESQWRAFVESGELQLNDAVAALDDSETVGHLVHGSDVHNQCRPILRLLYLASKLAAHEKRWNDASEKGLKLAQLGHAVSKGGDIENHQLGWVCIGFAVERISDVAVNLSQKQSSRIMRQLHEIDGQLEHVDVAIEKTKSYAGDQERDEKLEKLARAELRLCQLKLAIERFRNRNGELPDTLDMLAPDFISELPTDPISGQAFRLVVNRPDTGYTLYSVGFDGIDNAGSFVPNSQYRITFPSNTDFTIP